MSKEKGQHNRDRFSNWIAEMQAKEMPNWKDYWHGSSLSPKKIADELGFDSSAFKKSRNVKLFNMLEALKQELAANGISNGQGNSFSEVNDLIDTKKVSDEDIKDSLKIRELKRINRRLEIENTKLSAEVAKLLEFKEVLIEMGLWK